MYDVIVVGGRCGEPRRLCSSRDKATRSCWPTGAHFPARSHRVTSSTSKDRCCFRHSGLLDRLLATGCPPIRKFTMDLGDFPLTGTELEMDGVAFGYGPRRKILDSLLIDAASEAGVEFRSNDSVERYLSEQDHITGVRGIDARTRSPARNTRA